MKTIQSLVLVLLILSVLNVCAFPLFCKSTNNAEKSCFSSSRDGNWEVYMMNPDGSEQVNLTQHRADDMSAVWSSEG